MPLRPLAIRPPMDTLQANGVEGQQVLFMQQPAHTQHILLPSTQVQHLQNRVAATTQQNQAGRLWYGVTQPNGMYFQLNQSIAEATLPISLPPPIYVSPMYTQVPIGNLNYAPLEKNPATALFARPNYVMHPSNLIPSNDFSLAPMRGSISGINGHGYMQTLLKNVSSCARPRASVGAVPFKVASVNGINTDTRLPGLGDNRDTIENNMSVGNGDQGNVCGPGLPGLGENRDTIENNMSVGNGDQGNVCGPDDKNKSDDETDSESECDADDEADITDHDDSRNEDDGDGEGDVDVVEYIDLDDNQEDCAGCEDELEEYNGAKAESHQYMAESTKEDEEDNMSTTETSIAVGMEDVVVNHSMNGSNGLQYETVDVIANLSSKKRKRWPKGVKPPESRLPLDIGAIEKAMRNAQNSGKTHIFEPVLGWCLIRG